MKKFDREALRKALLLYAVTDRAWLGERSLPQQVEQAILGGATCIQLREKQLSDTEFVEQARQIKRVTDRYGTPLIINDRPAVAAACGADGVHLGQSDLAAGAARELLGPDRIIGVSAHSPAEARAAEAAGADYIGVGAVFSTSTKADVESLSLESLREICTAVRLPAVAIGGIHAENMPLLAGSGICGVAAVSAIFAQPDVRQAAQRLRNLSERILLT